MVATSDVAVRFSVKDADVVQTALVRLAADGQAAIDKLNAANTKLVSGNDSVAQSVRSANDDYNNFARGMVDHASTFLETVSHLKLIGVAAFALSPALRSIVTTGVTTGLGLLGANFGLVSRAVTGVTAVAGPALAFFTRLTIPVAIAVGAFKLLADTIERGSSLLEKYGSTAGQRGLFGTNVNESLAKLTRFQDETVSAQQIQYATQLGTRLEDAKRTMSDLFKVSFDLTDPALRLQNVWVVIVETLTEALTLLDEFGRLIEKGATAWGTLSIWDKLRTGPVGQLPGSLSEKDLIQRMNEANGTGTSQQLSTEQAFNLAKNRLAAGMGGGFVGRFNQSIMDLANPPKPEEAKTDAADAWTRYADQMAKATAGLEANTRTVGLGAQAHEQLKAQLQGEAILERDGVDDTEKRRKALEELAKAAGDAAGALEKAKVASAIDFDRKAAFLGPDDLQIAQKLKGIYGNDIPAALASSEAAQLRFNQTLSQINGFFTTAGNQITTGLTDILDGTKKAGQGFADLSKVVVRSLEEMIVKIAIVEPLVRSLRSALSGLVPGFGIQGSNGLATDVAGNSSGIFTGPAWQPGFAAAGGGNFAAGSWGVVGERGSELIRANPGGGVSIYDHDTSRRMMTGGLPGFAAGGFLPAPSINPVGIPLRLPAGGGNGNVGPISITIKPAAGGQDSSASAQRTPNNGLSIELMLDRRVRLLLSNDLASNGDITQGISRRFGLDATRGMA